MACGPGSLELSKSYMDMVSKLFTFTFTRTACAGAGCSMCPSRRETARNAGGCRLPTTDTFKYLRLEADPKEAGTLSKRLALPKAGQRCVSGCQFCTASA